MRFILFLVNFYYSYLSRVLLSLLALLLFITCLIPLNHVRLSSVRFGSVLYFHIPIEIVYDFLHFPMPSLVVVVFSFAFVLWWLLLLLMPLFVHRFQSYLVYIIQMMREIWIWHDFNMKRDNTLAWKLESVENDVHIYYICAMDVVLDGCIVIFFFLAKIEWRGEERVWAQGSVYSHLSGKSKGSRIDVRWPWVCWFVFCSSNIKHPFQNKHTQWRKRIFTL